MSDELVIDKQSSLQPEVIHISGHRIPLADIHMALLRHQSVSEALVIGVPDKKKGEVALVHVVLREGYYPTEELKNELGWYLVSNVGTSLVLKDIIFETTLPEVESERKGSDNEEIIHISGHKVLASDIEKALLSHRGVSDAIVIGVPNEKRGQLLYALVKLNWEYIPSEDFKRELAWHVRTRLGTTAIFKDIEFRDYLPNIRSKSIILGLIKK